MISVISFGCEKIFENLKLKASPSLRLSALVYVLFSVEHAQLNLNMHNLKLKIIICTFDKFSGRKRRRLSSESVVVYCRRGGAKCHGRQKGRRVNTQDNPGGVSGHTISFWGQIL